MPHRINIPGIDIMATLQGGGLPNVVESVDDFTLMSIVFNGVDPSVVLPFEVC